jgi:hypothetical protein
VPCEEDVMHVVSALWNEGGIFLTAQWHRPERCGPRSNSCRFAPPHDGL